MDHENLPRRTRVDDPGESAHCVIKPPRSSSGCFPGWGPKLLAVAGVTFAVAAELVGGLA